MLFYSPPTLIPCKEYVPFFLQSFQAKSYIFMEGWIYATSPNPRGVSKLILVPLFSDSFFMIRFL